ncbi:MAG: DUF294 nucleotidyltransferase-like domain-containing protein [Hyphomicrobium sp.]
MSSASHSTPLVAIDAVVLDTETTGLDSRTARIIQIGAKKIAGARIEGGPAFERILDPGIPVPPASSAVHGLYDADVHGKPRFTDTWTELETFFGRSIIIGHTIQFDLGMLKKEVELAGKVWRQPRSLDIRGLARVAAPTLANYELSKLAAWLDIEIHGRHTAMGDAEATARIYAALLPLLRARNVRTLAEAEAACRLLQEQESRAAGGFMADVGGPTAGVEVVRPAARLDSFPFRHRVEDVMTSPPATLPASSTLKEAIDVLIGRKISSVYVTEAETVTGILTERDALRAIQKAGPASLDRPLLDLMSKPLQTVASQAFVYRAIARMDRLGLRHLAVRDPKGQIIGAITTRNLLRHRAATAIMLGDEIDNAPDVAALGAAWARLPVMAKTLVEEGVDPRTVAAIISSEIQVLTRRAAQLAEMRMEAEGRGRPPVPYAVLVLGSGGRGESLLAADQDNAIVYETGEPGGPEDKWFEMLGTYIADTLDQVGVPYCKGGIMAKNAQWRMSVEGWRETIRSWVVRHRPEDLLNVDIFYDCVPVHGDGALADNIWSYAFEIGHRSPEFAMLLGQFLREWNPPFTMFGGFKLDDKRRVDLKKGGIMPIFSGARVLAIRHDVRARSTPERLRAVTARGHAPERDIDALLDAHKTILGAMLDQQLADTEQGIPLSPRVLIDRLGPDAKSALKAAVGKVSIIIELVKEGRI